MVHEWIGRVMMRDLASLGEQLNAYAEETDIWRPVPGMENTAGTLALHLAGNAEHYIGAVLGKSGYIRDREAEFATRDLPRAELLAKVEGARTALGAALPEVATTPLDSEYPIEVGGVKLSTGQFLIHLAAHLAYHLGQVDYHRRAITAEARVPGMQSIPALLAAGDPGE